jgi:phosphoglycolate phosphatase-like HAD superfamily hydrolase
MNFAVLATVAVIVAAPPAAPDPLPSWRDRPAKKAITEFVKLVTTKGTKDFVEIPDRIAVFDNDGTLWSEKPLYFHGLFASERMMKVMAVEHPKWNEQQPFKGILEGDFKAALAGIDHPGVALMMISHSGRTTEEFDRDAKEWIKSAKHPRYNRLYTDLVFQPMLEVLCYLRDKEFTNYIVSGGDVDFMKAWVPDVYKIRSEHVIGSTVKKAPEHPNGTQVQVRLNEIESIVDGPGKVKAIKNVLNERQPLMAFGNSDGDLQMLQYTTFGPRQGFGLIVHHTDEDREWAYDRPSLVGKLDEALHLAPGRWTVVDMKKDWKVIYPFQK